MALEEALQLRLVDLRAGTGPAELELPGPSGAYPLRGSNEAEPDPKEQPGAEKIQEGLQEGAPNPPAPFPRGEGGAVGLIGAHS